MAGTGTQADPFLVSTITELREAIVEDGKYLRLMRNINAEKEVSEWETMVFEAVEFDLNGYKIDKIYIPEGSMLFNATSGTHKLKNGKISASADANINALIANIQVDNVALSFYGISNSASLLYRCAFSNSSIDIHHRASNGAIMLGSLFEDCHVIINANQLSALSNVSEISTLNGCLVEGKINGPIGKIRATSSIFSASGITGFHDWWDNSYISCLNNSDLSQNSKSEQGKLTDLTQEQLENPDYINANTSFFVIKEE